MPHSTADAVENASTTLEPDMKHAILSAIGMATILCCSIPGCSTEPKTTEQKSTLSSEVTAALDDFRKADSDVQGELDRAAGYAVLPNLDKAGLGVGGTYGRGEVFEGGSMVGYCDLSETTVGAQVGAQRYSELIVFKDKAALARFKAGELKFAANASAVGIRSGSVKAANYRDGVAVFLHSKGGLMAEASIGGQKVRFKAM
jgi:lipid-binding SYLF domain-containing protein